jgi:hypothetical protein
MIRGNDLRRLIDLAFDYVAAETGEQAEQTRQAALRVAEATTRKVWLDLVDYMQEWNHSNTRQGPMSRASALQFFSTRQVELDPVWTGNP